MTRKSYTEWREEQDDDTETEASEEQFRWVSADEEFAHSDEHDPDFPVREKIDQLMTSIEFGDTERRDELIHEIREAGYEVDEDGYARSESFGYTEEQARREYAFYSQREGYDEAEELARQALENFGVDPDDVT